MAAEVPGRGLEAKSRAGSGLHSPGLSTLQRPRGPRHWEGSLCKREYGRPTWPPVPSGPTQSLHENHVASVPYPVGVRT